MGSMLRRALSKTSAGILAVALLMGLSVTMVRDPGFFGEEARFDRLFREQPAGFAACGNRLEYFYEAQVSDGGRAHQVHVRYEQLPVAAAGGRFVFRFSPLDPNHANGGPAVFAVYDPKGQLVHLYRGPETSPESGEDLGAISVAFGKAIAREGLHRIAEFPFDEEIVRPDRNVHFRGRSLLTASVKRKPEEVISCVEAREEDAVKESHLVTLPRVVGAPG
jgi:hypothetical protein